MARPVALGDLPLGLLRRLDLSRPMLNHPDTRPACAGQLAETGWTITDIKDVDTARLAAYRFCRGCPLLAECRAYADAGKEEGVWGGQLRKRKSWRNYQVTDLFAPLPQRRPVRKAS